MYSQSQTGFFKTGFHHCLKKLKRYYFVILLIIFIQKMDNHSCQIKQATRLIKDYQINQFPRNQCSNVAVEKAL
jgi:hypothetical protein